MAAEGKLAKAKLIGAALAVVLVIIIVFQNTDTVTTRLLFATVEMPRALLLAMTFALGMVAGILLMLVLRSRRKGKAGEK